MVKRKESEIVEEFAKKLTENMSTFNFNLTNDEFWYILGERTETNNHLFEEDEMKNEETKVQLKAGHVGIPENRVDANYSIGQPPSSTDYTKYLSTRFTVGEMVEYNYNDNGSKLLMMVNAVTHTYCKVLYDLVNPDLRLELNKVDSNFVTPIDYKVPETPEGCTAREVTPKEHEVTECAYRWRNHYFGTYLKESDEKLGDTVRPLGSM